MYIIINSFLEKVERKIGAIGLTIVISFVLFALACIYVRPAIETVAMGKAYAALSENPFDLSQPNSVGYRILTPVLSYIIGFRGESIIVTNQLLAVILIGLFYFYFRKKTGECSAGLLGAAVFTFSLVTLTTIYYGGYCDSLTYIIVFLLWLKRDSKSLFYILLFFGILNRESIVFLLPWLLLVRRDSFDSNLSWILNSVVGLSAVALASWGLREFWLSERPGILDAAYYFDPLIVDPLRWLRRSISNQSLGLFTVFKFTWIFVALALFSQWIEGNRKEIWRSGVLVVCVWSQLIIAWDSSRMLTLCFPIMIVALDYLFSRDIPEFRKWAFAIVIVNFLVPQLYTATHIIETMRSTPENIILMRFFGQSSW